MRDQIDAQLKDLPPEPPGIVSVNSRGGSSRAMTGKSLLVLLVLALLITGGAMGVHKYRQAKQTDAAANRLALGDPAKPVGTGKRRIFNTDPPALPGVGTAKPPLPGAGNANGCTDRSAGRVLLGPDGKGMMSPAGQPIRVCANGQVFVPAIAPLPDDASTPIPLASSVPSQGSASRTSGIASRYGGDVAVLASTLSPGGPAFDPDNPYIQALLRSSAGHAPNPDSDQAGGPGVTPASQGHAVTNTQGTIGPLLKAGSTNSVSASMIGNRDMVLPEGRSIDCNLSVRIVNEVSGKATCVLSSNVYSDNGKVVLAERGSTAVGEYVAHTVQGQRRLFILWTRLQTPNGVVINVNSPASDALGTSGLAGHLDNRWPERIGAAVLLSLVEDAIGYETAKASSENGNGGAQGVAVFQSTTQTGQRLAERILDSTINIKPTIYKQQGDRATIFVSRDLDFGSVYDLRAK